MTSPDLRKTGGSLNTPTPSGVPVTMMSPGNRVLVREIERIQEERWSRFPLETPNAGSVFKRPPGDFAGRLVEEAGCKGLRIGDAMVSTRHANFILNTGAATSADITALIAEVRRRVFELSGIYLQMEQILLAPAGR